jgi:membrane protease YdiL (CAAX protease family)
VHLNPWQFIAAFSGGILMGWAYYKTKSLISSMIIHFTNNLLSFGFVAYSNEDESFLSDIINNNLYLFAIIVFSLIILLIGGIVIEKIIIKKEIKGNFPHQEKLTIT